MIITKIFDKKAGNVKVSNINFTFNRHNSQRKDAPGKPRFIGNHWTVASRFHLYDDYHFNISQVKEQVFVFQTLSWNEKGQHLWQRNTGAVGITFCGMSNNGKEDLLTPEMIDAGAILNAEICAWKNINPLELITLQKKKYINQDHRQMLVDIPGQTIQVQGITDHATFGKLDGYGNIDIGEFFEPLQENARQYYLDLKTNKRKFIFLDFFQ